MSVIKGVLQRGSKSIKKKFGYPRLSPQEKNDLLNLSHRHPGKPVAYFEFGKNDLRRTLYTFLKFFDLAGINIHIQANHFAFAEMKGDIYAKMLIDERLFRLVKNSEGSDYRFSLSAKADTIQLTDDFFQLNQGSFYVPITQHPLMYSKDLWNQSIQFPNERQNSIFFVGNFDHRTYQRIKTDGYFDVIIRTDLLRILKESFKVLEVANESQLASTNTDYDVIIVNTDVRPRTLIVPMNRLRPTLSKFNFFLAAPGASIPHSHNLAEAMSVGSIPIIQKAYADLVYPALTNGKDALFFQDENHLISVISDALKMNNERVRQMSSSVLKYYAANMSPHSVVTKIVHQGQEDVRLLSFSSSIKKLSKNGKC